MDVNQPMLHPTQLHHETKILAVGFASSSAKAPAAPFSGLDREMDFGTPCTTYPPTSHPPTSHPPTMLIPAVPPRTPLPPATEKFSSPVTDTASFQHAVCWHGSDTGCHQTHVWDACAGAQAAWVLLGEQARGWQARCVEAALFAVPDAGR